MIPVYLETSALLAWLLGEPEGNTVRAILNKAETVMTSTLSVVDAERTILRAELQGIITSSDRQRLRGLLANAQSGWTLLEITQSVRNRAALPFPVEPVRTLDAIHLATALEFLLIYPDIAILTFDKRIADNIAPLGFANALIQ